MGFTFDAPTRIHFGTDITGNALAKEVQWLQGNILIVTTGGSLMRHGYIEQLRNDLLKLAGVGEVYIFDHVSRNPRLEEAQAAAAFGKEKQVAAVIGFGGGSALDAAKAAAVGVAAEDTLEEYLLNGKEPSESTLPIIAIPTTAGTGSELSRGAILSSSNTAASTLSLPPTLISSESQVAAPVTN